MDLEKLLKTAEQIMVLRGGPTSGNWAHTGRPGKKGGSGRGGGFGKIGIRDGKKAGRGKIKQASRQTRVKEERGKKGASENRESPELTKAKKTMADSIKTRDKELAGRVRLENQALVINRQYSKELKKRPKSDKALKARASKLEKLQKDGEKLETQLKGGKVAYQIENEHMARTKEASDIIYRDNLKKAAVARKSMMSSVSADRRELDNLQKELDRTANDYSDKMDKFIAISRTEGRNASGYQKAHDEYIALQDKRTDLHRKVKATQERMNQKALSFLAVDNPSTLGISSDTSKSKERPMWEDTMSKVNNIVSQDVTRPGHDIYVNKKGGRATAEWGGNQINVANYDGPGVVGHEIGHTIEMKNDRIYDRAKEWRDRRTEGERYVSMNSVTNGGYRRDEITKPDKFIHPYIGKDYGAKATEVISMGIEEMITNPIGLAERDPDMFDFMHAVLRSG